MGDRVRQAIKSAIILLLRNLLKIRRFRSLLFQAHPPNSLLLADCEQEKFLVSSSDTAIGLPCYLDCQAYDATKLQEVFRILPGAQSRRTLVDIGGNIGTISIYAISRGYADNCLTFEPSPMNFGLLELNTAINRMSDKIISYNCALSNVSGIELEFELSNDNYGDHRIRVSESDGIFNEAARETIRVPARMLDDFADKVDMQSVIVWIDVQGYEGFVLDGAKAFLSKTVPLVLEFWPYAVRRTGGYEILANSITKHNYTTIIDLELPGEKLPCTEETLARISKRLGNSDKFTDILVY